MLPSMRDQETQFQCNVYSAIKRINLTDSSESWIASKRCIASQKNFELLYRVRNSYLKCHLKPYNHLCINFRVTKLLIWAITKHILIELYLKLFLQPQFGLSRGHFPKSVRNTLSPPYVNVRILKVIQPLPLGTSCQFFLFWNHPIWYS